MSTASTRSVRVLGRIEVLVGDRPVDLGGAKPAAVLAVLLLHAPHGVSTDRLVDALWEDEPPRTARKSLHVHVSRLRKALPAGMVESEPRGYALRLDGTQVDLHEFRRLAERGREALEDGDARTASIALHEALALWRGPALDGLDGEPFARLAAARLEDERLAALELRIEADLGLRRHTALVGELESLVAEHPFRESFRRQLMLALYRSGRQTDALAAYRETRRFLADELGLEPGPELRELEAAVLRQDPSIEAPAARTPRGGRSRRPALLAAAALGLLGVAAAALFVLRDSPDAAPVRDAAPLVVANSVVEIDPRTGAIRRVTRVGRLPDQLATGPGGVWVVNKQDRTVTRIGPRGAVDTIGGVVNVDHVASDRDGVWVSSFDRPTVARIDAATLEVDRQIGVPSDRTEGLAVGGGYLWVTNPSSVRAQGTETVSRIDLRSGEVVSTVAVGKTPIFTTFGYGAVWVANYDDDTVSVISPGSPEAETVDVADGPLGIATGFGGVWVACYWPRQLVRIDPAERNVIARIALDEGPLTVAAGAGGVWVTNRDSGTVVKVSPRSNKVVLRVRLPRGLAPFGVAVGKDAVWVSVRPCDHPPCL